jgi:flagella basal body P-ring formation protein FlgA
MTSILAPILMALAAPGAGAHPDVERLARAALLQAIPFPHEDVRISRLRVPSVRLPRGALSARAEMKPDERYRGLTTFALIVGAGDREERVWATAEIRVKVPTLVAARDLPRGHVLRSGDLCLVRRELADRAEMRSADVTEVVGRVLRRPLRAHEALLSSDLEKAKVVSRGAAVFLVARQGGLVVTARGRALEDGARGETVRALNLSSGKTVLGRVDDPSHLVVEF